jgi:hypothetical protein
VRAAEPWARASRSRPTSTRWRTGSAPRSGCGRWGDPLTVVPSRFALAFVAGAIGTALLVGLPTDVIPNDWFGRMTPVRSYDLPVLVAVSLLSGLLVASHWGVTGAACPVRRPGTAGAAGAALGWFAIGCPVRNKLVVLAIGTSGALEWFAPAQPWLAGLSVALLLGALAWRWRVLAASRRPRREPPTAPITM